MPLLSHRLIIKLSHEASDKRLLEGIDVWLRLGLISDVELKRLCRENLCSTIPNLILEPIPKATLTRSSSLSHASQKQLLPATIDREPQNQFLPATMSKTAQVLQYLMAEFSLMWLLFLGVFMVVVSSGVLAVSQWRQFPPQGQYLILFSYTLAFWVASVWTGRRENLRLTSHVLKITTLLIISVNFWMLDQSKLWTSGLGLAIAASLLTAIIIRLLQVSNVTLIGSEFSPRTVNHLFQYRVYPGWTGTANPGLFIHRNSHMYPPSFVTSVVFYLSTERRPTP